MMNQTWNPTLVVTASANEKEAELISVATNAEAPIKKRFDACRQLARIGTKKSIEPLAALLTDEKMSHMARYGLEANPDEAVDAALRKALRKVKGKLLAGVIGSLSVRSDAKAVKPISKCLKDTDSIVVQAAARALGSIGTASAAKALDQAVGDASKNNLLAFCEGLFRCAEALAAKGKKKAAQKIYRKLESLDAPEHVKTGVALGLKRIG